VADALHLLAAPRDPNADPEAGNPDEDDAAAPEGPAEPEALLPALPEEKVERAGVLLAAALADPAVQEALGNGHIGDPVRRAFAQVTRPVDEARATVHLSNEVRVRVKVATDPISRQVDAAKALVLLPDVLHKCVEQVAESVKLC